jgi:CheY-like chemotaxis protein
MRPQMIERRPNITGLLSICTMVVDDDDAVRGAIADALRDSGYRVAEASSGEGALRRLERIPPAVLVSDVNLGPGMSGLELAATVHKLWPATGVLLVSADPGQFTGGEEFLSKPFSTDRFLKRVARIAERMRPSAGSGLL